jgi:hypothetical protein
MCDAACSLSEAACGRRCSTLCHRVDCARTGRDKGPRRVCCLLRAGWDGSWRLWWPGMPPWRGVLAGGRPRYSRGLSSCFANPLIGANKRKCPRGVPLEARPPFSSKAPPFAKKTAEEIVPNGWRRNFGADTKH